MDEFSPTNKFRTSTYDDPWSKPMRPDDAPLGLSTFADPYPLAEAVCVRDGILENVDLHRERYLRSRARLAEILSEIPADALGEQANGCPGAPATCYPREPASGEVPADTDIGELLAEDYRRWIADRERRGIPGHPAKVKGRLRYGLRPGPIEWAEYPAKGFVRALLIEAPGLSYGFKWADRNRLETAAAPAEPDAYPVFTAGGLVTDALSGNAAFMIGGRWVTPRHPLLEGTKREKLIREGVLAPVDITCREALRAGRVSIINALNDPGEWMLPIGLLTPDEPSDNS